MSDLFKVMFLMLAGLSLGACAGERNPSPEDEAAVTEVDPFELSIRIGRMGVMLNQGEMALGMIAGDNGMPSSSVPDDDVSARRALYGDLSQAALNHNRLWVRTCEFDASLSVCQNMFEPGWMGLPFSHAPTWRQLDRWADEVQERVGALSGVLCIKAEGISGQKPLCLIE